MKKLFSALLGLFVIMSLCITVCATDESIYPSAVDSLIDVIDDDTQSILESLGLSSYSYEELYNISFSDIVELVLSIFKGSLYEPIKCVLTVIGTALIGSVGSLYISKNASMTQYLEMITVIFISFYIFTKIISCVSRTVTAIESLGVLMKVLVPVIAVMATITGSPTLAISYNSVTVYIAQVLTAVCRDFLTPLLVVFDCIALCLSINSIIKSDSILNMIKKCINMILGLIGTVFTGVMALKDILSTGADKVSVKGIKFLLGSSVPVVGSALSDGLSAIIASVTLMKNTFGVLGIIVIIVILLPTACELILWMIMLSFSSYFCDVLSQNKASTVISSLRFSVSMLLSILLFTAYILVVSTGLVILMGNK